MRCPACDHPNLPGADECGHCHTPLTALDAPAPNGPVETSLLTDPVAVLDPKRQLIDDIERDLTAGTRGERLGVEQASGATRRHLRIDGHREHDRAICIVDDECGSDRFSGPVSLESRLATRGASEAALVAALSGEGRVTGTVTVAAKMEEQAGALLLGVLGQKVREVRGLADSTTMLFAAFTGAPAQLDGSFRMEEGVARSEDLTLRGRDAVARG